jgi:hypothetical protein
MPTDRAPSAADRPPPDGRPFPVPLKRRQHEVELAAGAGGLLAAAWTDDAGSEGVRDWCCGFAVSTDGGATWSEPVWRKHPGFAVSGNPTIAVDAAGCVHAVAMSAAEDYGAGVLEAARSEDGGRSWSPWQTVIARSGGFPDRPRLAIGRGGELVLVHAAVSRTGGRLKALRAAIEALTSADRGAHWAGPERVSPRPRRSRWFIDGCQGAAVLAVPGGGLLVSWADYFGNHAHVAARAAGAAVFGAPRALRLQTVPGRGLLSALLGASYGTPATSLAADPRGSRVALAVHEAHAMAPILLFGSRDGGREWSRLGRLSVRGTNPALAFDRAGRLHALWTELDGRRIDTRYAMAEDPFGGFAPALSLAGGGAEIALPRTEAERRECEIALGSYQSLVVTTAGRLVAAWVDLREGLPRPRLYCSAWQGRAAGISGADRS